MFGKAIRNSVSSVGIREKIMLLLKKLAVLWILLVAAIAIGMSAHSVLAQDSGDDSGLSHNGIHYKDAGFAVKGPVTIAPGDGCGSLDGCFDFMGYLKSQRTGSVYVTGSYGESDCTTDGKRTCCDTSGYEDLTFPRFPYYEILFNYSGSICSTPGSEEKSLDANVLDGTTPGIFPPPIAGKGTQMLTDDPETGHGILSITDQMRVPIIHTHRCGTQKHCLTKGCCNGGCCIVIWCPRCP